MDPILTVVLTVEVLVWALVGCGYVWWRRDEGRCAKDRGDSDAE